MGLLIETEGKMFQTKLNIIQNKPRARKNQEEWWEKPCGFPLEHGSKAMFSFRV